MPGIKFTNSPISNGNDGSLLLEASSSSNFPILGGIFFILLLEASRTSNCVLLKTYSGILEYFLWLKLRSRGFE